jgi:hypothetical protein
MNARYAWAECALFSVNLFVGAPALAGPADYVYTPIVEEGEREIDFKIGSASKKDADRFSAASLGLGYAPSSWWFTEFYVKYQRKGGPTHFDAVEWENRFQLTETGKYPVDVGFVVEIERPRDHAEGWELRWGPLFQGEFGKVQLNGNLLLERHYRSAEPSEMLMQYQVQAKYRYTPQFEFGVQGLGELGPWRQWNSGSEQTHQFGPAIFGKVPVGSGRAKINYNVALLFGLTNASADHTLRAQVEYEF